MGATLCRTMTVVLNITRREVYVNSGTGDFAGNVAEQTKRKLDLKTVLDGVENWTDRDVIVAFTTDNTQPNVYTGWVVNGDRYSITGQTLGNLDGISVIEKFTLSDSGAPPLEYVFEDFTDAKIVEVKPVVETLNESVTGN